MNVEDRVRLRVTIVVLVVVTMFAVLLARLWFLQILAGEEFAEAATRNSVRIVTVEAPRGKIVDRDGRVLVTNRTALAVGIRKDDLPDDPARVRAIKRELADLLGMTIERIDRRLTDVRTSPYRPIVIDDDVPEDVFLYLSERRHTRFPGVETLTLPVRHYPRGTLGAHLFGYVGETTEAELEELAPRYRLGDPIGRTGLERQYERWLRGVPGLDKLIVDASGRVLDNIGDQDLEPGATLVTSLDLDVQRVAEQALKEGILRARSQTFHRTGEYFEAPAGAAVVLDVRTGEVVAMASHPTYKLSEFVGGVDDEYWTFLNDPRNDYPLLNRALQATYPPGSTFKPILAVGALDRGDASPYSRHSCTSSFTFGDTVFNNWTSGSGPISLEQALVESCDTVFYRFAQQWWFEEERQEAAGREPREVIGDWARRFGLGSLTGIDLPQEEDGTIPGREWKQAIWEANRDEYCGRSDESPLFEDLCERGFSWRGGDAVNMSIGQGDVETTPLQMATVYAALANGGKVLEPRLARAIVGPEGTIKRFAPVVRQRVKADPAAIRYVQRALGAVVERGTASYPFRGWPQGRIPVGAKTGSSEIVGRQPFSWFAAIGPLDAPRYAVVAVVEEAGFGSQVAGPVVRRIMDELFGLPPLPIEFNPRVSD